MVKAGGWMNRRNRRNYWLIWGNGKRGAGLWGGGALVVVVVVVVVDGEGWG